MVLGLLVHVTPSNFFRRILRNEVLVYNFRTAVLQKLLDIRFSYSHCNFSNVCLLVKMASKTVTRSIAYYDRGFNQRGFYFKLHVLDGPSKPLQVLGSLLIKKKDIKHKLLVTLKLFYILTKHFWKL